MLSQSPARRAGVPIRGPAQLDCPQARLFTAPAGVLKGRSIRAASINLAAQDPDHRVEPGDDRSRRQRRALRTDALSLLKRRSCRRR